MASKRNEIRMSPSEIEEYLKGRHTMYVATLMGGSFPHLVAMWYGFYQNGSLGFWTFSKSQKAVNLSKDNRLTCLVESGDDYMGLKGVEMSCWAKIFGDDEKLLEIGSSIYERYFGNLDENGLAQVNIMKNKRIAVELEVIKTVSWDHSKLGGRY